MGKSAVLNSKCNFKYSSRCLLMIYHFSSYKWNWVHQKNEQKLKCKKLKNIWTLTRFERLANKMAAPTFLCDGFEAWFVCVSMELLITFIRNWICLMEYVVAKLWNTVQDKKYYSLRGYLCSNSNVFCN